VGGYRSILTLYVDRERLRSSERLAGLPNEKIYDAIGKPLRFSSKMNPVALGIVHLSKPSTVVRKDSKPARLKRFSAFTTIACRSTASPPPNSPSDSLQSAPKSANPSAPTSTAEVKSSASASAHPDKPKSPPKNSPVTEPIDSAASAASPPT
jgi:hypothetical protein